MNGIGDLDKDQRWLLVPIFRFCFIQMHLFVQLYPVFVVLWCKYHMDFRSGNYVFKFILSLFIVPLSQNRIGWTDRIWTRHKEICILASDFHPHFPYRAIVFTLNTHSNRHTNAESGQRQMARLKSENYLHTSTCRWQSVRAAHITFKFPEKLFRPQQNRFVGEWARVYCWMDGRHCLPSIFFSSATILNEPNPGSRLIESNNYYCMSRREKIAIANESDSIRLFAAFA